jgi:hypothetical protein
MTGHMSWQMMKRRLGGKPVVRLGHMIAETRGYISALEETLQMLDAYAYDEVGSGAQDVLVSVEANVNEMLDQAKETMAMLATMIKKEGDDEQASPREVG